MLNIGDISSLLFRHVTGAVSGVLHPASHLSPQPVPPEQIQIASKREIGKKQVSRTSFSKCTMLQSYGPSEQPMTFTPIDAHQHK